MAAPVGGQIFSEILPYLEVVQSNTEELKVIEQVEVPNIEKKSIKEAEKITKELGIELNIENLTEEVDKENTLIKEQIPKEGVKINKGTNIYATIN